MIVVFFLVYGFYDDVMSYLIDQSYIRLIKGTIVGEIQSSIGQSETIPLIVKIILGCFLERILLKKLFEAFQFFFGKIL